MKTVFRLKKTKSCFPSISVLFVAGPSVIYMEFRKMAMMALYARQKKRLRYKEQTFGLCGGRRGWDDLRK